MLFPEGESAKNLIDELFPLRRSLVSRGTDETLRILNESVGGILKFHYFSSGETCGDWKVPNEWNLVEASLLDPDGRELINIHQTNLHVVVGSESFHGQLEASELLRHIYVSEELHDAVPYVTNYYGPGWGLCLSKEVRDTISDGLYTVKIVVDEKPGRMVLGEVVIPGLLSTEVLFPTYACHPQMANNELSGPAIWVELLRHLKKKSETCDLKFSYRFYIGPETLGAIFYLNHVLRSQSTPVIAGFQLTCIGASKENVIMPARRNNSLPERVLRRVLSDRNLDYAVSSFSMRGSDERQWCFPGVDLPVASYMSAKYHDHPEYHTSHDDLDFVTAEQLQLSFDIYREAVEILEYSGRFKTLTRGEPRLDLHGLYPTTNLGSNSTPLEVRSILNILSSCDGSADSLSMADDLGLTYPQVKEYLNLLQDKGLVSRVQSASGLR